jgi:hypothetical protein
MFFSRLTGNPYPSIMWRDAKQHIDANNLKLANCHTSTLSPSLESRERWLRERCIVTIRVYQRWSNPSIWCDDGRVHDAKLGLALGFRPYLAMSWQEFMWPVVQLQPPSRGMFELRSRMCLYKVYSHSFALSDSYSTRNQPLFLFRSPCFRSAGGLFPEARNQQGLITDSILLRPYS